MPYLNRDQIDEVIQDVERKQVPLILMPPMRNARDPVVDYAKAKFRHTDLFGSDLYVREEASPAGRG
jgi:hypothetical protein